MCKTNTCDECLEYEAEMQLENSMLHDPNW